MNGLKKVVVQELIRIEIIIIGGMPNGANHHIGIANLISIIVRGNTIRLPMHIICTFFR